VIFIETPIFTRLVQDLLSDDEYRELQIALIVQPDLGPVIQGSGGLRKVRWALPGRGKRGWRARHLLFSYPGPYFYGFYLLKGETRRSVRGTVKGAAPVDRGGALMDNEMFAELVESVKEMKAIMRGEAQPSRTFTVEVPDVKAIRETLKFTQQQFAAMMGISVRTLQNWEQGRRSPEGPARVLLMVAARNPQAVLDAVQASKPRWATSGNVIVYSNP